MKNTIKKFILPGFIIASAGFIFLGLGLILYFLVSLGIESIFFPNNVQDVPQDSIRSGFVLVFAFMFLIIFFLKIRDLFKAIALVPALAGILIVLIFRFYMNVNIFLPATLVISIVLITVFIVFKKSWYFSYATILATGLALLYAWPQT